MLNKSEIRGLDRIKKYRSKPLRKKLIRGTIVTLAGLSIAMAGLFHSPADFMKHETIDDLEPDHVVEMVIDEEELKTQEEEKRRPAKEKGLKAWIRRLPLPVKACVALPLWAVGFALNSLISVILTPVLGFVGRRIVGAVLSAAVLAGVYAAAMKFMFPDMKLKDIFSKRNIFIVLGGVVALNLADILLGIFWPGYERVRNMILLCLGAAVLMCIIARVYNRKKRRDIRKNIEPGKQNKLDERLLIEEAVQKALEG